MHGQLVVRVLRSGDQACSPYERCCTPNQNSLHPIPSEVHEADFMMQRDTGVRYLATEDLINPFLSDRQSNPGLVHETPPDRFRGSTLQLTIREHCKPRDCAGRGLLGDITRIIVEKLKNTVREEP